MSNWYKLNAPSSRTVALTAVALVVAFAACRKEPAEWNAAEEQTWMSGGAQTVFDQGAGAFAHPFPGLNEAEARLHAIGDAQFDAIFVSAPAPVNSGLGPIFNNVACSHCHIGDGRGRPPENNEVLSSMLFRIAVDGGDAHGGPAPVPGFGGQLQPRAIFGAQPEGQVAISYTEQPVTLADGSTVMLRAPGYQVTNTYTALPANVQLSPRVAPPVFGLGLLEAIPEASLQAQADPGDVDANGISGVLNQVWDREHQRYTAGRFGWKADQPSVVQQTAAAYVDDMGITNPLFPQESSAGQPQHDGLNDDPELSDSLLQMVGFYVRTLAVPARRNADDPEVKRGQNLFTEAGCARCHTPMQRTGVDVSFPAISNQVIFPYTDLLLHDMGSGLADGFTSYAAGGQEWRTPPLWGIGLTNVVNGHQFFLHDGRARSLLEAVLWHGGEAQASNEAVRNMTAGERQALLAFLHSL
jgi:CxxC motif-containing protein (DUF1111 family)